MDLLQTVRKEGSRGGVNFSWDDVKTSDHRENYLGHSLMAPVGRWQQNKDLNWYAKAEDAELTPEERAEKQREAKRAELRKVKEAEEDAMARALGLPVPERRSEANDTPLGLDRTKQAEVNKALKEALGDEEKDDEERGVGFGAYGASKGDDRKEVLKGSRSRDNDRNYEKRSRRADDECRSSKRRHRPRSRSRDRDGDGSRRQRRHRHERSRSRSIDRQRRRRSRDRRQSDGYEKRRRDDNQRSRSRDNDHRRRRSRSRSRSTKSEQRRRRSRSR